MVPSFWRRWPFLAKLGVAVLCISISLSMAAIPLYVWLPHKSWQGWDGYGAMLIYMCCLMLLSLFLLMAGALTIAPEREKQTWESLYLATVGVTTVVRAKLMCRLTRCAAAIVLTLPFWIAWGFEVFIVNRVGPTNCADTLIPGRLGVYLGWLSLRTVGHVLPCVAIGMMISSYCRKGRTALSVACMVPVLYGSLLWVASSIPLFQPWNLRAAEALVLWPIMPVDWDYESPYGLMPAYWGRDAIADAVWMVAIPALCYLLSVWKCRMQRP